ncbi:hypothetical protein BDL97_05G065700 [Sphagnum fallax]|nr:hypothetical protein BDL97_05G065700 [Sphagnum fallax]
MTSKKGTSFQKVHALDFAFEIVSTDVHGDVIVQCLFYLYQGRDVVEKQYFNGRIKATNMLHHHFDLDKDTYEFFICTEIVNVIINDLFFHNDEQLENIDANNGEQNLADAVRKKLIEKQNEKKYAMKLFCKEDNAPIYTVTIKDILRFDLAMDYVSIGMLFRQTAATIQKAKDRTKTTKLAFLNDRIIGQYTHVLVVVALQQIVDILDDESV